MHIPSFLSRRAVKLSLIVLAVVLVSIVAIKSQTAAPSLSSANENNSQNLAENAGMLAVSPANAANLGGSTTGSIQGQSTVPVQGQAAASPQAPAGVQQSPVATAVQQPTSEPRQSSASSALKGTVSIRDTGSTNVYGWTLQLYTDGSGALLYASSTKSGFWNNPNLIQFPKGYFDVNTLARLITDVGSMSKLQPSSVLTKSGSFGTSEYATYLGATSGDLLADYSGTSSAKQRLQSYLLGLVRQAKASHPPKGTLTIEPGPR